MNPKKNNLFLGSQENPPSYKLVTCLRYGEDKITRNLDSTKWCRVRGG